MKLLLDENLSPKLLITLGAVFPDSAHVDRIGLGGASDNDVWQFAKDNNFVLTSKDSDFYEKSMLYGHPPKVVWIKRGNCSNRQLAMLLLNRAASIHTFYLNDTVSFMRIR